MTPIFIIFIMGKGDSAIVGDFEVTKDNDVGFTGNGREK